MLAKPSPGAKSERLRCRNGLGELRDRSFENRRYRASGLNLVIAAIVLWNTVYLGRAIEALKARGQVIERALSDAVADMHGAENDFHVAELCRHLAGLAPAIRLVWAHVLDARLDRVGACCTDGGPVEP